jgi:hypothetical protein
MKKVIFYTDDISIIYKAPKFISCVVLDLKSSVLSNSFFSVFSLTEYKNRLIADSNSYKIIAILCEADILHVILLNNEDLIKKIRDFDTILYEPSSIELIAYLDLIGPVRKFSIPQNMIKNSSKHNMKFYIDDMKNVVLTRELIINNNKEEMVRNGKWGLIRFVNNMSYILKIGINIRHFTIAEKNNTGISYSLGEIHQSLPVTNIETIMKMNYPGASPEVSKERKR